MENEDRLVNYQMTNTGTGRDLRERMEEYIQRDDRPYPPVLTPPQRRRMKHKKNSPKTHSHDGLVMVDADGKVRRQACTRCNPRGRQPRAVGGVRGD
jgi:hypothetical protein